MGVNSYLWEIAAGIAAGITILTALLATSRRIRTVVKRFLRGPDIKSVVRRPFKYREVHRGLGYLSERSRIFNPDLLVGINRGGAILGGMIGKRLGMMARSLEVTHRPEDPVSLPVDDSFLAGKKVLLLDDRIRTGTNVTRARDYLLERRAADVYILVFALPHGWSEQSFPHDFAYEVSSPDLPFPWEPGSSREWK